MKARNLFVALNMFAVLLVFISFSSCGKDNVVSNEEIVATDYLTTDKPLPSYVMSAFKEQILADKTLVSGPTAKPYSPYEWEFDFVYSYAEVHKSPFGSKTKYYNISCRYICRIKISNGFIDFQKTNEFYN